MEWDDVWHDVLRMREAARVRLSWLRMDEGWHEFSSLH
jgi:hypothetical protein